jgi:tagaturonate reductase
MKLSRNNLKDIHNDAVAVPAENLFDLPEKVLQFGTGVLLRGLPDFFIDQANRKGIFNGRIVVVKSTAQGDASDFDKQDGLFTLCVRGYEQGQMVEENIINASISRVLNAADQWEKILECAHNPGMQVVISNTTEVGIQLVKEEFRLTPPSSFPAKLLAFLYERFQAFGGSSDSGLIIIPTELISDNGKKLEAIVLELAHWNKLEQEFIEWLNQHNRFCNSLVDRIVPGKPEPQVKNLVQEELGYEDELLIMSEVYRLWAIEGDEQVKNILSFAQADDGVIIAPDITLYKELKLRLLNGTHTLSCGLAFLAPFNSVKDAMDNAAMSSFINYLMLNELAPAIPFAVPVDVAKDFGNKVLDRFRNPMIKHQWINITVQYTSKMKMRIVPLLLSHYRQHSSAPQLLSLGFAGYLLFTKPQAKRGEKYFGLLNGEEYPIQDESAASFMERWNNFAAPQLVKEVLSDTGLWGENLFALPGFYESVIEKLNLLMSNGVTEVLETVQLKKEVPK